MVAVRRFVLYAPPGYRFGVAIGYPPGLGYAISIGYDAADCKFVCLFC